MRRSSHTSLITSDAEFEAVARLVRWLAIATVLATYPFGSSQTDLWIIIIGLAAGLYNLARYSHRLMRQPFFASRLNSLVTDSFIAFWLLGLTGGVKSPYYLYLLLAGIAAVHWYGLTGL